MFADQHEWLIRCEWGAAGIAALAPTTDVFIIVDVLSFSTCVDIAVSRGAHIYPYDRRDASAAAYASQHAALLASHERTTSGWSLSPASLQQIPAGTRLVLPSPNGATLTLATGSTPTFAGCLRNAQAVARAAQAHGERISVIAAGERWPDGTLRPAIEDLVGAGAVIAHLTGSVSPEAAMALQAFRSVAADLPTLLSQCSSGKELIARDCAHDVTLAAMLNQSACAPRFQAAAYVPAEAAAPGAAIDGDHGPRDQHPPHAP